MHGALVDVWLTLALPRSSPPPIRRLRFALPRTPVSSQVDDENRLTFRIDLALEDSLIVPIMSVLNESQLYATWMPSWNHPRLGIRRSVKLHELGRGHQVILVTVDMPYPLATREVVQYAVAIDDIDEHAAILIRAKNVEPGDLGNDIEIPPAEEAVVRLDFDCSMVIRSCPDDHPVLSKSKKIYPPNEKKLLLTIKQYVDAHVKYVPLSIINFFTRQVIKQLLGNLIKVAEEVQSGKRVQHKEAIESQPELYSWVEGRVKVLCSKT
jgi:hypothetical protein